MAGNDKRKFTDEFLSGSRPIQRKRIVIISALIVVVFALLFLRTAWIQIVNGEELSRAALEQQTSDNTVSAKRGKIYDRNFKVLAGNVTVETISITPQNLRDAIEKHNLSESRVAEEIADILKLKAEDVEKKIKKTSGFEYLKKKVDKDMADELREYIELKKLSGINFVDDVKRYYPYTTLHHT